MEQLSIWSIIGIAAFVTGILASLAFWASLKVGGDYEAAFYESITLEEKDAE